MEPQAHHIVIGLLTLLLLLAGAAFGLWMLEYGKNTETKMYNVVFNEPVRGLSEGSSVEFNGIRVGSVRSLRIDQDDPSRVIARIGVAERLPVNQDTTARLAMTNITGSSHIQLRTDTFDSAPLQSGKGAKVPVIQAEPSPIAQLRNNWEEVFGKFNAVLENTQKFVTPENAQSIAAILDNVEHASGAFASQEAALADAVHSVSRAGDSADQAFERLDGVLHDIGGTVATDVDALLENTSRMVQRLNRVSTRLDRLMEDNERAMDQGLQSLHSIQPAIRDFREAVRTLQQAVRHFDRNPARYLLGRDQLPEFEP
ncbi:MAG: MlaD family protein [Thermodesulfobacteriota bacterium]